MQKIIYVVWEDCHGEVAYFEKEEDAKKEVRLISREGGYDESEEEGCGYYEVILNNSWVTRRT